MIDDEDDEIVRAAANRRAAQRESIIPRADGYMTQLLASVPPKSPARDRYELNRDARNSEFLTTLPPRRGR